MRTLFTPILLFLLSLQVHALELNDFQTDGCSAYPDGVVLLDPNRWVHCCITHDMAYWVGGTQKDREKADDELKQCVSAASTNPHGFVMELGVRLGGIPWTSMPWRWGYGWDQQIKYKNLTLAQKRQVVEKFDSIFYTLIDIKDWLSPQQKGFVVGRFELLRHNAFEDAGALDEEMHGYDERYELLRQFLDLD